VRLEELDQLKNLSDLIGNRTRDLPTCGTVPQPTTLLRASRIYTVQTKTYKTLTARNFREIIYRQLNISLDILTIKFENLPTYVALVNSSQRIELCVSKSMCIWPFHAWTY
jgi:thiamine biosynthesis protein ThiC